MLRPQHLGPPLEGLLQQRLRFVVPEVWAVLGDSVSSNSKGLSTFNLPLLLLDCSP